MKTKTRNRVLFIFFLVYIVATYVVGLYTISKVDREKETPKDKTVLEQRSDTAFAWMPLTSNIDTTQYFYLKVRYLNEWSGLPPRKWYAEAFAYAYQDTIPYIVFIINHDPIFNGNDDDYAVDIEFTTLKRK